MTIPTEEWIEKWFYLFILAVLLLAFVILKYKVELNEKKPLKFDTWQVSWSFDQEGVLQAKFEKMKD